MPLQNAIDVPANAINPKLSNISSFQSLPIMTNSAGAAAATTVNTFNIWSYPQYALYFEQYNSIASTNVAPAMSATAGLGINLDNITGAVSKTIEITEGNNASAKNLFVARTSAPFFVQASFNVNTLANVTDLFIGFRKQQTYAAALATYTDYATIGVHSTAGHIQLQTQLASGGNTVTDTTNTITATTTFTVRVNVDGSGNVTYLLNGVAPTTVAAYQFAALSVIPFILYSTPAGGHTEVDLISYQCGLQ